MGSAPQAARTSDGAAIGALTAPGRYTERLYLRPLSIDDLDAIWRTLGNAEVQRHYVDIADHSAGWSKESTERFIRNCERSWTENGFSRWGVELREIGELVGYSGLDPSTTCRRLNPP